MSDITGVDFVALQDQGPRHGRQVLRRDPRPAVREDSGGTCPPRSTRPATSRWPSCSPTRSGSSSRRAASMVALAGRRRRRQAQGARGAGDRVPRRHPRLRRLPPGVLRDPDGNLLALHHRYAPKGDPLRARVDVHRAAAGEAGQRHPAVLGQRDRERRGRADADEDRRARHRGLLDELERQPPAHAQDVRVQRQQPVESARPITLSIALWRPTSSRTHQQLAVGGEQPGGVQAAGAGEARLAQPLGQVGEQCARDRQPGAAAPARGRRPPRARPSRTPRTRTWCRRARGRVARQRPRRPRPCCPRSPRSSPAGRGPSISPSP